MTNMHVACCLSYWMYTTYESYIKSFLGRKFTFEAGDLEFTFHPSKICNQEVGGESSVCMFSSFFHQSGAASFAISQNPHLFQLEFFHTSEEQLRLLMAVAWEPQSNAGLAPLEVTNQSHCKNHVTPLQIPIYNPQIAAATTTTTTTTIVTQNLGGFVALSSPHL